MPFNNEAFATSLGKKIQEYRQRKNFTLEQVVREAPLSISRSSLSAIENGSQDISARDLFALGKLLGFTTDALLDEILKEVMTYKFSINLDR